MSWVLAALIIVLTSHAHANGGFESHVNLSCSYDANPLYVLGQNIRWTCETSRNTNCVSYIRNKFNDVIDVFPDTQYIDNVGIVSYYPCNQACLIEFPVTYLTGGENYTFGVACESDNFEANVTPQFYLYQNQIAGRAVWFKSNTTQIFIAIIIIAIIIIIILLALRKAKELGLPIPFI